MDKICKSDGISMRKKINELGTIFYYNDNNKYHREDGPAIEYKNGTKFWYKNGKYHREDGPAIEFANGSKYYYNDIEYSGIKTDEEWIRFVNLMVFQ